MPDSGDVLVNELLFNPATGGSDFVELYNNSGKILDLQQLRLGHWDAELQSIRESETAFGSSYLFYPGEFLALTENRAWLRENYPSHNAERIVETNSLPSLSDDAGSLAVAATDFQVLDYARYSEDAHLSLIEDPEGVSLERVDTATSALESSNWQSAAAQAGYATPGLPNSQQSRPRYTAELTLEPRVFSPNQDGYHDFVKILYRFSKANNVGSVSIYSAGGRLVKQLADSENLSRQGFFTWDGTGADGNLQKKGIYIVAFDYFHPGGRREVLKKTCVLSL